MQGSKTGSNDAPRTAQSPVVLKDPTQASLAGVADWEPDGLNFPRKQLRRANWTSLNGDWNFRFDHELEFQNPSEIHDWNCTIQVPFAPEAPASGIGDTGFHNRCWYQRTFKLKKTEMRNILHFNAVDYESRVWVNGHFVGSHEGGNSPFCFDITDCLQGDGELAEQTVSVCADDDPLDLAKPRGKQDWQLEPHSIWYPRTSGIWQTVWIEEVPETYIERLLWTPLLERWEIGCEAFIKGPCPDGLEFKIRLVCQGKLLANDTYAVINHEIHRRIALSDPGIDDFRNELLWSPEKPTLIHADLELWLNGERIDRVRSYTALRNVSINRGRLIFKRSPDYLRQLLDTPFARGLETRHTTYESGWL
jgi:beta-galactosidase/beta-glucuronidase